MVRRSGRRHAAWLVLVVSLWGVLLGSCALFEPLAAGSDPLPPRDDAPFRLVRIAVCPAAVPLGEDLAAAYGGPRHDLSVELVLVDPGSARAMAASSQVDLALVAASSDATIRRLAPTLDFRPVARDALAIVVHPERMLDDISLRSLEQLYAGYIADWSLLEAGSGRPEFLVVSEPMVAREIFDHGVMTEMPISGAALVLPHDRAILSRVAEQRDAIGYLSFGHVAQNAAVKVIALEGTRPSSGDPSAGEYPLRYSIYMALAPEASAEAMHLHRFVLGRQGQQIIAQRYGLVD